MLPHKPSEFDCCECGRHIILIAGAMSEPPLCGLCIASPGWFRHDDLRALLDPDHDGLEVCERQGTPT